MSERDYTKAPFDFDLPEDPTEADWLDPFMDPLSSVESVTEKRPGDLFRDVKHGNTAAFPTATKGNDPSIEGKVVKYGKLNWNNSY